MHGSNTGIGQTDMRLVYLCLTFIYKYVGKIDIHKKKLYKVEE